MSCANARKKLRPLIDDLPGEVSHGPAAAGLQGMVGEEQNVEVPDDVENFGAGQRDEDDGQRVRPGGGGGLSRGSHGPLSHGFHLAAMPIIW
jgi:hypothetical protein